MKNKKRLPYLLASLFIIVVVIIGCRITLYQSADYEMIDLNENWLMSINIPDCSAISSMVMVSSPSEPIRITSSPSATSGISVTSTMN